MLRPLLILAFSTIPLSTLAACNPKSSTSASTAPTASTPSPDAAPTLDSASVAQKPTDKPVEKPPAPKPPEPKPDVKPPETEKSDAKGETPPTPKPADGAVDEALATMREFIKTQAIDKTKAGWKTKLAMPPKLKFEAGRKYSWLITTSEGPIRVRLMADTAPMHVSSTIYLAESGFYDGLLFHRVIPGFMAQGGCPLGTGTGSPGYKYAGEFTPLVKHERPGMLSMANAGPGTDGSQFFLTFEPTQFLDGKHTVFGEVVEGMETLKKLETFGSKPSGQTSKPLTMVSTKIVVE